MRATTRGDRLITPLFGLLVACGLCYFLSIGAMLPVLPRYVEDVLGGTEIEVGVVVGAFAVSAALVRPSVGRLGDLLGRRAMALAGSVLAAVSIAPLGLVEAVWYMILLRLVTGIGEACFFIGAATAAQDLAPDHRRGEAASFFSVAIYGGLAFGPVAGEVLYRDIGADLTFLYAAAACTVSAVLSLMIPAGMGRIANPPPRRGLLHPAALQPGSVLLLGVLSFTGFATFVPLYVDEIGTDDAAPFFLAYGVIVISIRIIGARIPDRLGPVRTSRMALASITASMVTIFAVSSTIGLWIGTVLLSVGMSLLFPALFSLAVNRAPSDERSHAVGTFSLFFDLSQGLGAPALGAVVWLAGGAESAAFVAGAVVAAVGLMVANTRLRGVTPLAGPDDDEG